MSEKKTKKGPFIYIKYEKSAQTFFYTHVQKSMESNDDDNVLRAGGEALLVVSARSF